MTPQHDKKEHKKAHKKHHKEGAFDSPPHHAPHQHWSAPTPEGPMAGRHDDHPPVPLPHEDIVGKKHKKDGHKPHKKSDHDKDPYKPHKKDGHKKDGHKKDGHKKDGHKKHKKHHEPGPDGYEYEDDEHVEYEDEPPIPDPETRHPRTRHPRTRQPQADPLPQSEPSPSMNPAPPAGPRADATPASPQSPASGAANPSKVRLRLLLSMACGLTITSAVSAVLFFTGVDMNVVLPVAAPILVGSTTLTYTILTEHAPDGGRA